VPERLTTCGLVAASSVKVSVPVIEPVVVGEIVPSVDRNVRVPPAIVNVPGGFATLLPPDNEPPELVKPP